MIIASCIWQVDGGAVSMETLGSTSSWFPFRLRWWLVLDVTIWLRSWYCTPVWVNEILLNEKIQVTLAAGGKFAGSGVCSRNNAALYGRISMVSYNAIMMYQKGALSVRVQVWIARKVCWHLDHCRGSNCSISMNAFASLIADVAGMPIQLDKLYLHSAVSSFEVLERLTFLVPDRCSLVLLLTRHRCYRQGW